MVNQDLLENLHSLWCVLSLKIQLERSALLTKRTLLMPVLTEASSFVTSTCSHSESAGKTCKRTYIPSASEFRERERGREREREISYLKNLLKAFNGLLCFAHSAVESSSFPHQLDILGVEWESWNRKSEASQDLLQSVASS